MNAKNWKKKGTDLTRSNLAKYSMPSKFVLANKLVLGLTFSRGLSSVLNISLTKFTGLTFTILSSAGPDGVAAPTNFSLQFIRRELAATITHVSVLWE